MDKQRRALMLCLSGTLAGCAVAPTLNGSSPDATPATFNPPTRAASLGAEMIVADDGARLPLRSWLPAGKPTAIVLALHGFNDYSNAFAGAGAAWAQSGIATFAYDQRGFGAAPERGSWVGTRQLTADAAMTARLLRQLHPHVPMFLLGESMGGAIAIVAAAGRGGSPLPPVDGVILVAPAVWGRQIMSFVERAGLWMMSVAPSLVVSGSELPGTRWPSDNMPMLRAFSADPLVIKGTRADAVLSLVDLMTDALDAAPSFTSRALLLYGAQDVIVPRQAVARFIASLPPGAAPRQRFALYPHGYHMLMRDLDGAVIMNDVAAWMRNEPAPLPSGADRNVREILTEA